MEDPIDSITWVHHSTLTANDYNPNRVFDAELKLLEFSILRTGWIQPVLACRGEIVDGCHRWWLTANSPQLDRRYGGTLPVAMLDLPEAERMLLTIRINRAKGSHVAVKMAEIIRRLKDDHDMADADIAQGIGATLAEVHLLYTNDLWKRLDLDSHKYSQAWIPEKR